MGVRSERVPLFTTRPILAEQHNLQTPNCAIISPFNAEKKFLNLMGYLKNSKIYDKPHDICLCR